MYWPTIRIEENDATVVDAFLINFFINRSHLELVDSISNAIEITQKFIQPNTLKFYIDGEGYDAEGCEERIKAFQLSRNVEDGIHLLSDSAELDPFEIYYWGQQLPDTKFKDLRNYFYVWLPSKFVKALEVSKLVQYIKNINQLLMCSYVYATPALRNYHIPYKNYHMRYPGFDIMPPSKPLLIIGEKASGVYWVNILGNELTSTLGGIKNIRSKLSSEIFVESLANGNTFIQIGKYPDVGDTKQGNNLVLYKEFRDFIAPYLINPNQSGLLNNTDEF